MDRRSFLGCLVALPFVKAVIPKQVHPPYDPIGANVDWSKYVDPPGLDPNQIIDTTTMYNSYYRTHKPRRLVTAGEWKLIAQYRGTLK